MINDSISDPIQKSSLVQSTKWENMHLAMTAKRHQNNIGLNQIRKFNELLKKDGKYVNVCTTTVIMLSQSEDLSVFRKPFVVSSVIF